MKMCDVTYVENELQLILRYLYFVLHVDAKKVYRFCSSNPPGIDKTMSMHARRWKKKKIYTADIFTS